MRKVKTIIYQFLLDFPIKLGEHQFNNKQKITVRTDTQGRIMVIADIKITIEQNGVKTITIEEQYQSGYQEPHIFNFIVENKNLFKEIK